MQAFSFLFLCGLCARLAFELNASAPPRFPCRYVFIILSSVPIFLECQRCAACCRWPGQVRLSEAEISRLAAIKGLAEYDFIQAFTRLRQDRRGLALKDKADGSCIFLEDGGCAVQAIKPQQCRDFPNLWSFAGAERLCRAIAREVSAEEYARRTSGSAAVTVYSGSRPL